MAAQAKHAEGGKSDDRLQRDAFVAVTIRYQSKWLEDTIVRMEDLEGELPGLVTGEQLR